MPSGARKIEQGLPSICGTNHSPTASKYSARSRFVTGTPSPASGHNTLSDLVTAIPKTVTVAELAQRDDPCVARLSFLTIGSDISASAFLSRSGVSVREVSVSTSLAGLSLRRPLNDACRTIPSPVHPAYSISATNSGFNQRTSLPPRGALLPEKGLLDAATAFNSGMMRFTTLALYPVPTVPV